MIYSTKHVLMKDKQQNCHFDESERGCSCNSMLNKLRSHADAVVLLYTGIVELSMKTFIYNR